MLDFYSSVMENLLYTVKKDRHGIEDIRTVLGNHKEVQFVSLVGIDFSGNGTDEKIPISTFIEDLENLLKNGVQTDGSSVVLQNIATLDNAKVIILPDLDVDWYVDYNFENISSETGKPIGTLRIPSFLVHDEKYVCSRSILKKASNTIKTETLKFIDSSEIFRKELGLTSSKDIKEIVLTSATELEFWVQTPEEKIDEEKLSVSQILKEQYWKRTDGVVRSALENVIKLLDLYGFEPEMGHKEVGGVKSKISTSGISEHIMEQLEIDWKYDNEMHACDKEHFIRHLVKDVFHLHKLEVTFRAKPIEGVAGSGKHVHIGVGAKMNDGTFKNLFSHLDFKNKYLTSFGISSLMGILKNYEVINPFVAWSNDSINRLKPHFEAPICIVSSLGQNPIIPSRNRSILIGLIKDPSNPYATRFELRSPCPGNNVYLILSVCYQAMIDGIYGAASKMNLDEMEKELSKKEGEDAIYLEKNREYRSERNVFNYYTREERLRKFGTPPETVYENLINFDKYPDKMEVLKRNEVFNDAILKSYHDSVLEKWKNQLKNRIIGDDMTVIINTFKLHKNLDNNSDLDDINWAKVNSIRLELMKDDVNKDSVFTKIKKALDAKDYQTASDLQQIINSKITELKKLYLKYKKNLL